MTSLLTPVAVAASLMASSAFADPGAYLEITLKIAPETGPRLLRSIPSTKSLPDHDRGRGDQGAAGAGR